MSEQSKIDGRSVFEAYMLGREHPVFGWITSNWFGRGDNQATYENDYVQGCWVMWQARSLPVGVPDGEPEWPEYHDFAMGCGLDDRGITDRYKAMRYGWDDAVERCLEAFNNWLAAPTVKAEQVQTGAEWVMRLLDTGEWHLTRFRNDPSMTEDYCRRNSWQVERQCAPYCGDNEVTFWRAETAEQAFTAAINDLFPGRAAEFGRPAPALPAAGSAVESWRDQVQREFPNSEPDYWPDSITTSAMGREIRELRAALSAQQSAPVSDYEECLADHRRLVRELDVLLNGEDGAAPQASLCDIVGQVSSIVRDEGLPILSAFSARKYAPERVSVPFRVANAIAHGFVQEQGHAINELREMLAARGDL